MTEQTTSTQKIALVTGANKGIGYEIAAGLGALGWSVGVGARDEGRREAAVQKLREAGFDAFGVPLDVTEDASVAAAAALIEERAGRLDVLINNAGVTGGMPQEPTQVSPEQLQTVVETNVIGAMRVTNALCRCCGDRPRRGSSTCRARRLAGPPDRSRRLHRSDLRRVLASKTFLNAVTVQYAKELADTNILIDLACPGYVATDLNGFRGFRSPSKAPDRDSARHPARQRPHRWLLRRRWADPLVKRAA